MLPKFATKVLDHVTSFQDMVLAEVLGLETVPEQKSWGLATQKEYGQCIMRCKTYLRDFLSTGGYRIIVAQEREFNVQEDGVDSALIQPYVGAGVSPSLLRWVNPAVDAICQTFLQAKTAVQTVEVGGEKVEMAQRTDESEYCFGSVHIQCTMQGYECRRESCHSTLLIRRSRS